MSSNALSPFEGSTRTASPRPSSTRSKASRRSEPSSRTSETSPLLATEDSQNGSIGERSENRASALLRLLSRGYTSESRKLARWPSVVALGLLCLLAILVIIFGYLAPSVVEQYALEAASFRPTNLTIDSFTKTGVRVKVQGEFSLDASKVRKKSVRNLGRLATWVVREVETGDTVIGVQLLDYGNVDIGAATIPGFTVSVRNRQVTPIELFSDLEPRAREPVRSFANDWLSGAVQTLNVAAHATVAIRSGILRLGHQHIAQQLVIRGHDLPQKPEYNSSRIHVDERRMSDDRKALVADASLVVRNPYPIQLDIPPLSFQVLVNDCELQDPYIKFANATSAPLSVKPYEDVKVVATGIVETLPEALVTACPGSSQSPLDLLVGSYLHGHTTKLFVRGSDIPLPETPTWMADFLAGITVPVAIPNHQFGGLVRNFSLENAHFALPDASADPDSPEARPKVSAKLLVVVALPEEISFPIDVQEVRADASIYYKGSKLGRLDLQDWQSANSTRVTTDEGNKTLLAVESAVKDSPLEVTDENVFSDVVQALIFGHKSVLLSVEANVDVRTSTALGDFVLRALPASGQVTVKPPSGGGFDALVPRVGNLVIVETGVGSMTLQAHVNFTNPTPYSATVPFIDVLISNNSTVLGHVRATDLSVIPGPNVNAIVQAVWNPIAASGAKGRAVGRELISQYISGYNTTLTLKTHNGTIPSQPRLGAALQGFEVTVPMPHMKGPSSPGGGNGDDEGSGTPHFIKEATMHLFSSTAVFTLMSPLQSTTMYMTHINATAYYHGDPVGKIIYDLPLAIPPGISTTPRLPVDWSLNSVGYEAVKSALGGTLKLDARATCGVRIGTFEETVWYSGGGIGAKVRL